jgi:putative phosphoesterase
MEIGLISDTHNHLPDRISLIFKDVDLIIHAGDIGYSHILENLKNIAPVEGVYGNTDIYSVSSILPSQLRLELEGLNILVRHDIGNIKMFHARFRSKNEGVMPDIIIFGHTHRPLFEKIQRTTYINPGSASKSRSGIPCSVMRLRITAGIIMDYQLIQV